MKLVRSLSATMDLMLYDSGTLGCKLIESALEKQRRAEPLFTEKPITCGIGEKRSQALPVSLPKAETH